jgi:hypothetical protein
MRPQESSRDSEWLRRSRKSPEWHLLPAELPTPDLITMANTPGLKPKADENEWSNRTHKSCRANDVQRPIRQGIWTQMVLPPGGSSLDKIRRGDLWALHDPRIAQ